LTATKKLRIGVDLDDVCIEFTRTLVYRYNQFFNKSVLDTDVDQWSLPASLGGPLEAFDTYEQLWEWAARHFIPDWCEAPPVPNALQALNRLSAAGHTLVCITSRETEFKNVAYASISRNRFPFDEVHVTDDKVAVPRCDVYIDDSPTNLEALVEAYGIDSLVVRFSRPWNNGARGVGAQGWNEIETLIQNFWKNLEDARLNPPSLVNPTASSEAVRRGAAEDQHCSVLVKDKEVRITDPKTGGQKGQKLAQVGALDPLALLEVARVAGMGASKYSRYNFLKGYDWSLSFDALQRHLLQFWSGEDYDTESGRLHVAHAAWHCAALTSFILRGLGTDDRFKQ
jgi:uncharacterized HAD superfamily protein